MEEIAQKRLLWDRIHQQMVLDLFLTQRTVPDTYNAFAGGTVVDSVHAAIGFCRDIGKFPGMS